MRGTARMSRRRPFQARLLSLVVTALAIAAGVPANADPCLGNEPLPMQRLAIGDPNPLRSTPPDDQNWRVRNGVLSLDQKRVRVELVVSIHRDKDGAPFAVEVENLGDDLWLQSDVWHQDENIPVLHQERLVAWLPAGTKVGREESVWVFRLPEGTDTFEIRVPAFH